MPKFSEGDRVRFNWTGDQLNDETYFQSGYLRGEGRVIMGFHVPFTGDVMYQVELDPSTVESDYSPDYRPGTRGMFRETDLEAMP